VGDQSSPARQIGGVADAAATVSMVTAAVLTAFTLLSLIAVATTTTLPRVRRYLRTQRPTAGFALRARR
jgi:hypothetical protein